MPEITTYKAGTPCWVDLASTDLDASKTFYNGLFGWEAATSPDEEAGGYTMFLKNGKEVAAVSPPMGEGQPPVWATYIATDDADATSKAIAGAGGMVLSEPFDVMDVGRMGVFMDPTGAAFCIWQPKLHLGAGLVNEPGALCWNELHTSDPAKAQAFYSAVFGYTAGGGDFGDMPYIEVSVGDATVAAITGMGGMPEGVPPFWLVYFAVDDCDGAVAKVQELGGSVMAPPMDIPVGRFSVVADNQGSAFGIIKLAQ
jgi:predicted enzyme related to lactoylglutathione lyase